MRRSLAFLLLCSAGVPACDSPGEAGAGARGADAAGGASVAEWSVVDSPTVVIGAQDGPPGTELAIVRTAVELSTGDIAVADMQSNDIRIFGRDGSLLRTLGGNGSGPGEFTAIWSMARTPGDTMIVYDLSTRRLSWFNRDGFITSTPFEVSTAAHPEMYGPFQNGALLVVQPTASPSITDPQAEFPEGAIVDSAALVIYTRAGELLDTLGWYRSSDIVQGVHREGIRISILREPPAFGRTRHIAAGVDRLAVGHNDSLMIDVYSMTGERLHTIRHPVEQREVTRADIAEFEDAVTDPSMPPKRAQEFAEFRSTIPAATTMPAFGSLYFDTSGNLWVGEYTLPRTPPRNFLVFDRAAALIARVRFPPASRVLNITDASVLLLQYDADGVPIVTRHELRK